MSTHADLFQFGSLPLLMEHHSDSGRVTYTPRNGNVAAVSAIVGNEVATEDRHDTGRRRTLRRPVTITTDPAGTYGGVASPALNATVTVDGVIYAIESVEPLSRDVFDLVLVRHEAMEVSNPAYRRGPHQL